MRVDESVCRHGWRRARGDVRPRITGESRPQHRRSRRLSPRGGLPAASQCTGVDGSGREVTFDPGSRATPKAVAIDPGAYLFGVACPSTHQCTAVDFSSGQELTFNPTAPGSPTAVTIDGGHFLTKVACPSVHQCTAVDGDAREVTFDPTSPGSPMPHAIDTDGQFMGIACPSTINALRSTRTPSARSRSTQRRPEADSTRGMDGFADYPDAVACPSLSQCTAVTQSGTEVTLDPVSPGNLSAVTVVTAAISEPWPMADQCTAVDGLAPREVTFNPVSAGRRHPADDFRWLLLSGIACSDAPVRRRRGDGRRIPSGMCSPVSSRS